MGISSLRDGIDKLEKNLSYDFWNGFQSIHPLNKELKLWEEEEDWEGEETK
jgi:hypothetical protein